jgi:hypothetical protein
VKSYARAEDLRSFQLEANVKTKKAVTERVLLANRANGKKNTGPRNTNATCHNAITHGLLSTKLVFRNDDEKQTFDALVAELAHHHEPLGPTEQALVSEMAISLWRLHQVYGWESSEMNNRKNAAAAILRGVRESGDAENLPLYAATEQGWDAQELIVRTGTRTSEEQESFLGNMTDRAGHIVVEAKLTSSLETILRYQAAIKRDYYRSLGVLRELQRDRLELAQLLPGGGREDDAKN